MENLYSHLMDKGQISAPSLLLFLLFVLFKPIYYYLLALKSLRGTQLFTIQYSLLSRIRFIKYGVSN